jgi:hypothetical protein
VRNAKDTGLRALLLHDYAHSQIWCAIIAMAGDIVAWMQLLKRPRAQRLTRTADR